MLFWEDKKTTAYFKGKRMPLTLLAGLALTGFAARRRRAA
jgi:hypothetical protein